MRTTAMLTRSRALLLAAGAAGLAACSDAPSAPSPSDLDLLRAAALASDSLAPAALGAAMPMSFGVGAPVPVMVAPPGAAVPVVGPGRPGGCTYSSATGRTTCGPFTVDGMTFESSFAFLTRDGVAQERFDPATTDKVDSRHRVSGTMTRQLRPLAAPGAPGAPGEPGEGSVTMTVDRSGQHTTSGLLDPSGRRRYDGTGGGSESQVITTSRGTARVSRQFADTTSNLVVPAYQPPPPSVGLPATRPLPPAPLSGRIVRVSRVVETPPGATSPRTSDVRVVTEFLEGGVARTTITVNGVTRVCTQNLLERRPPTCG